MTQAPTITSLLSLSSPDDSPYRESEVISSLPVPDDGHTTVILDEESVESLSRKKSKTKVVTKQVSIEQVFSRKKKADASLNLEGMEDLFQMMHQNCVFALREQERDNYQFLIFGEWCSTFELLKACF